MEKPQDLLDIVLSKNIKVQNISDVTICVHANIYAYTNVYMFVCFVLVFCFVLLWNKAQNPLAKFVWRNED